MQGDRGTVFLPVKCRLSSDLSEVREKVSCVSGNIHISIWKRVPGSKTAHAKALRQKSAWHVKGLTAVSNAEWGGR